MPLTPALLRLSYGLTTGTEESRSPSNAKFELRKIKIRIKGGKNMAKKTSVKITPEIKSRVLAEIVRDLGRVTKGGSYDRYNKEGGLPPTGTYDVPPSTTEGQHGFQTAKK